MTSAKIIRRAMEDVGDRNASVGNMIAHGHLYRAWLYILEAETK